MTTTALTASPATDNIDNNDTPATHKCGLNPTPNRRVKSDTPHYRSLELAPLVGTPPPIRI